MIQTSLSQEDDRCNPPTKERYGAWMLVTRKDTRAARKPDPKNSRIRQAARETKMSVYNNQLFSSRFAPISDLEEEVPIDFQGDTPRVQLLHGESSKAPAL